MTTHALTHDRERSGLARWIGVGFLSGALAVLLFHQPIAALLHSLGVTPRAPYSMQATQPFGLPQLWSLVFWGAVWGVALAAALRRLDGASLVLAATVFGAILPSLVAWTIVASLKAVGVILVVAMLVAPGATAYLVTRRFERMLVVAAAVAVASSVLGTLVSFHINGSTGPCIVLIQAAIFALALLRDQLVRRRRGAMDRALLLPEAVQPPRQRRARVSK